MHSPRVLALLTALLLTACGEGLLDAGDPGEDAEGRDTFATDSDGCAGIPHSLTSASSINGGDTGAFVREMSPAGYRSMSAHLVVPDYATSSKGEQPWIYYGLGDGRSDTEAGLSFQRGNSQLPHRWLPYLRKGSRFVYGTRAILPGTRIFMKAYYGDGAVHLQIDNEVAGSIEVSLDTSSLRARRVVGLATPFAFTGKNLTSDGLRGVLFEETQMIHVNGAVKSLRDVSRYFSKSGLWYGSVCWPGSHVQYRREGAVDRISLF